MVDFIKTKLGTNPTPVTVSISPTVVGSNEIQMKLGPLPSLKITSTPEGSGWQKFNAKVTGHMITTVGDALLGFAEPLLQAEGQKILNEKASFKVPSVPISVDGISVNLTPSNLAIGTSDDHLMVTADVNIS